MPMALPSVQTDLKLTYDDYLVFPDDGRRHEIIDGVHYVSPAPSTRHQEILGYLFWRIMSYLREGSTGGKFFSAPCDVVLSEVDVVQPDLLYVSRERASIVNDKNVRGAPDLVIEIVSESTRRTDEVVKRKLYGSSGVREYWIVDPVVETVKVHRPEGGRMSRVAELTSEEEDVLESPLFPGLEIPLAELFSL